MLPERGADALYNLGNHVGIEPSDHAGRQNLHRKSQKNMLAEGVKQRLENQNKDPGQNKSDYTFI